MDLMAQYIMVDHQILTELMGLDNENLISRIMKLNETYADEALQINKLWDGLHFMLTGISAQDAVERPALSKAVIGANMFNADDDERYFICYTTTKELPAILNAMEYVDLTALAKKFKPVKYRDEQIYPEIWLDDHSVALFCELSEAFQNLQAFTQKACDLDKNIVFSIY